MYQYTSKLIVYKNIPQDSVLMRLSDIIEQYNGQIRSEEETIVQLYEQVHTLLDIATSYGFNENLWQNYLTYLLITTETPFSMTCEKVGANHGSVNLFVKQDYKAFMKLFHYDFSRLEQKLGIDCFTILTNYESIPKLEQRYNRNVSEKVQQLSKQLAAANDVDTFFDAVTQFYRDYGVGTLGLNKAFRVKREKDEVILQPITNTQEVYLSDLVGYEIQKKKLVENTEAFIQGRKANNVLLYGDSGTGKSTSMKAILSEYYDQGLRMIEIYKHQFEDLSTVIAQIKNRNYKFIIYMDDLSFEEFEIEYKYLKAVIEGGLEIKPNNVLIYATSNRRHLIRETWSDRTDVKVEEMHHSDTMQEKLSLVARFGVTIHYGKPNKKDFNEIVRNLARRHPELTYTDAELDQLSNQWELSHGGTSGRCAEQFVTNLLSRESKEKKLVPDSFQPLESYDTEQFHFHKLSPEDTQKDYEAVITAREFIRSFYNITDVNEWPTADLTIEEDRMDLARHLEEFNAKKAFAYTVMDKEQAKCLGCFYIDPPENMGTDASVSLWGLNQEITDKLYQDVRKFIVEYFPFKKVEYPVELKGKEK